MRVFFGVTALYQVEMGGMLSADDDRERLTQSGRAAKDKTIPVTRLQH